MAKSKLRCREVRALLRRIAAGEIEAVELPREPWECNRSFRAGRWSFVIFDDCGQMDYVDEAESPSGRRGDCHLWWKHRHVNPMPGEWRDSHGDNPLGRALKWRENSDYK